MADRLIRVFGTEEDRVNCPFFFKMGACRHGDRCSRLHHRPVFSQTILLPHMYQNPRVVLTMGPHGQMPQQLDMRKIQEDFEDFYEEVFEELAQFGEIEALNVCDNLGDHLVGNVYVKFSDEEAAAEALKKMHGRYYAQRMLTAEFSPVTDFREARCRQFDDGMCKRGDQCNFMHLMRVPRDLRRDLFDNQPHRSRSRRHRDDRDDRRSRRHDDDRRHSRRDDDRRRDDRRRSDHRRRDDDRRRHDDRRPSDDRRRDRHEGGERKEGDGGSSRRGRDRSRSPVRRSRRGSRSRSRSRRHRSSRSPPRAPEAAAAPEAPAAAPQQQ